MQGAEQISDTAATIGAIATLGFGAVIGLAVFVGMWKVFTKAGEPGWAMLVPFYNLWVLSRIAGKSPNFFWLFFVPLANVYAMFALWLGVARQFGKGTGYGLGLIFLNPIFVPMLGFSSARHQNQPA